MYVTIGYLVRQDPSGLGSLGISEDSTGSQGGVSGNDVWKLTYGIQGRL